MSDKILMRRKKRVTVRLSDEEWALLDTLSSHARMPPSTYLREAALEGRDRAFPDKPLTELRVELDRAQLEVGLLTSPALQRAMVLIEKMLQ